MLKRNSKFAGCLTVQDLRDGTLHAEAVGRTVLAGCFWIRHALTDALSYRFRPMAAVIVSSS